MHYVKVIGITVLIVAVIFRVQAVRSLVTGMA